MKKKKNTYVEEEEKFRIYQMSYDRPYDPNKNKFRPSQVCSPFFGTRVLDRSSYRDNKGVVDPDLNYDYIRKDEDKHLTTEDIIKKKGREFYEFDILTNEKAAEYAGAKYTDPKTDTKETKNEPIVEEVKTSFVSSVEDVLEDQSLDTMADTEDLSYEDEDKEFKFEAIVDEEDNVNYNDVSNKMPQRPQTNIPTFLADKEEAKIDFGGFDSTEDGNDDLSFDIPEYKAPKVNFDEIENEDNTDYATNNNSPIDRNISIDEAISRGNQNEFPDEMEGKLPFMKEERKPTIEPQEGEIRGNDYSNYSVPYDDLFKKSPGANDTHPAWLEEKKQIINTTLESFNIKGEVIDYTKGPTFTLYEIMLDPGVLVSKIVNIKNNLTMNLSCKSLRILAPIPGRNTVGIEAPNDTVDVVSFGDIIDKDFIEDGKPLNVALGKNIEGLPVYQDITDMPHALIAGATQSGKSVSVNTIIVSLLLKNRPDDCKLILVDPKTVEFSFYQGIPHLATPVITDLNLAAEALKWATEEMDRRYIMLAQNRCRKISEYNKKRTENPSLPKMPYIVVILDEFNDLIMQVGQEVNDYILRLAQKARACGMHIILATQRPTTNIVNGTIKANFPCRIAFRVSSYIDSMTILDSGGAEDLLGRGDMLIQNSGAPLRAQGAYISDREIEDVCNYLIDNYQTDYLFTVDDLKKSQASKGMMSGSVSGKGEAEDEMLLYKIARSCVDSQTCSINSIQTQFGIGFNRASKIVTILQERNIVSAKNGTKARDILVDKYQLAEMFGVDEQFDDED